MDLSESIIPRSDQLNSDDLIAAPAVVTITDVRAGTTEQPIEVHLAEFPGRPYKPSKSMRRVLVQAWGSDGSTYTGRRLKLFRNPEITFGREKVGGIEIAAMSHLDKRLTVSLMVTRGKRKPFTVEPLKDAPKPAASTDIPAEVKATVAKVKGTDSAADYLAWLDSEGAPDHIKQYAKTELGEK